MPSRSAPAGPKGHIRAVPKATAEMVVALRRSTDYGPRRLAYYLAQEGMLISVFGIYGCSRGRAW